MRPKNTSVCSALRTNGEAHRQLAQEPIHPEGTIEEALPQSKHLGPVDMTTVEKVIVEEAKAPVEGAQMSLGDCLNLEDFEVRLRQRSRSRETRAHSGNRKPLNKS